MYVFTLYKNSTNRTLFYLREVMNAGSDSDAREFDNLKTDFLFDNRISKQTSLTSLLLIISKI